MNIFLLASWTLSGILSFISRKERDPNYWRLIYWLTYAVLEISLIEKVVNEFC